MPKMEAVFEVIAPERPGEGPVIALADSILYDTKVPPEEQLIPMPEVVDGIQLVKGMRLLGLGHIFVHSGADVRPHGLRLLGHAQPGSTAKDIWG